MNIIFIAPPAAGKGTLSDKLVSKYNYKHLSTGDLLREEIKKQSDLGKRIDEIISKGELVSDEIITELLKNELVQIKDEKFILDGYPRNIAQAEILKNLFEEIGINNYIVIYLDLEKELAMKRALGRVVCSKCGTSYNTYFKNFMPEKDGICDKCGNQLKRRSDDTEETFNKRFDTYLEVTSPVLEYYKKINKLNIVDANVESADVFKIVEQILEGKNVDNK